MAKAVFHGYYYGCCGCECIQYCKQVCRGPQHFPNPNPKNVMNWTKALLNSVLAGCAVLLASCATSSPQSRIESRPADFQALPEKHKAAVQQGRIAEGMNRDAVWIAWGPPNRISRGAENGATFEIWRYTGLRPVYTQSFGMGISSGYYRHGHSGRYRGAYCDPFYDYQFGPTYVPYKAAEVKFRNGKVASWEKIAR